MDNWVGADRLIYRFKQFYFGMFSKYLAEDEAFAKSYLNESEFHLFRRLPDFEKKHAVIVAEKMSEAGRDNPQLDEKKLAKLGLLHDIGKTEEHNSVITKSYLVFIRYFFPWLYDWLADLGKEHKLFRKYYIHKHHGAVGADLLEKIGVTGEFLSIIRKHDPCVEPFAPADPIELKILQEADSTY